MRFSEATDSQLVAEIQSGNSVAFEELMRRYKRPVVNFVYRIIGNVTEADDISQDVFVRVYQNLGAYKPATKFTTWLFALARNASIDHLRKRQRRPTEPLEAVGETPSTANVANEIQAREISEQIAQAISSLPEDQRTAIILSVYHGLAYSEIAEVMRCSEKSVEARLYRARLALRRDLEFLLRP